MSKIKYFFILLTQRVFIAILAVDETTLCCIVTDLQLKGLSLNKIREHLKLIYGLDLTKHKIKMIQNIAGKKAKAMNRKLDREIRTKVNTTETDEVFQGRNYSILGAAEKFSQYLLDLKYAPDRTAASITKFLKPISKKFCNIKVVISDLYKAYKTVIPEIFHHAQHLGCHVHAYRESMRHIKKIKLICERKKKKRDGISKALEKLREKITKLVSQKADWERKLAKDRLERQKLKLFKRNSKSGRTKTIDQKLIVLEKRFKRRVVSLKDTIKALKKARKTRDEKSKELSCIVKSLKKFKNIYLQSCRLGKEFYHLLKDHSIDFKSKLQKFMIRLEKSPYVYASQLHKMIKNNPQIFSLQNKNDLASNYQNSNTIERIFGIFRPLLDLSKLFQTVEGTTQLCELFRLYYNTTPRYTGIHNDQSPFEQLGGNLNNRNYLDLLFPLKKRTTLFFAHEISMKTTLGFHIRRYPHRGAIICR